MEYQGNGLLFDELFRRLPHYRTLFQHISYKMKMSGDFQDLLQGFLFKLLNRGIKASRPREIDLYLSDSFYKHCISFYRKKKERNSKEESYGAFPQEDLLIDERDPLSILIEEEQKEFLFSKLGDLTDNYRRVIELRFLNGLSYSACASELGIEVGNARARVFRGLDKLKKIMSSD